MKSTIKKLFKKILPIALVLSFCIGTSFAFLSANTRKLINNFTVATAYMDIELQEPSWDPDALHIYNANETFAKDPQIQNTGNKEAYVYMSVFVPEVNAGYYNSYSGKYTNGPAPAYRFTPDNSSWSEFWTDEYETGPTSITYNGIEYDGTTRIFAYRYPLASKATTEPLFENMTFINYDVDVENALEDDKNLGVGEGSEVLGKEFPVFIQAYAITTDVDETMMNDHKENEAFWNCGPVMAWEYFVESLNKEYEGKPDKPEILSVDSLSCGAFTVMIYDAEGLYVEETVLKTATNEFLSLDCVNSMLTELGYTELFENEEEMYAAFSGYMISDQYGIFLEDMEFYYIERAGLYLKEDLAKVNVVFNQDGETVNTLTFAFKQGTQITSEVIQAKLAEKGITVELSDVQIDETAVNGVDFTLNVVLDSDIQETT